jgi:hypothetical protein
MSLTTNKWFVPFLLVIIAVLLGYFAVDAYNHVTEGACENQGSSLGTGQGSGRALSQIYFYLLVGSIIVILCVAVPIVYFLISRNVQRQLEENTKLISEMVYDTSTKSPSDGDRDSSKLLFLKFLSYAENKVIKKLIEHDGTVLQSEVSRMESMGKVRTHRIITELKKKEIIQVEPYGKTNRISLTDDAKNVLLK